jgi:hypothetical protein
MDTGPRAASSVVPDREPSASVVSFRRRFRQLSEICDGRRKGRRRDRGRSTSARLPAARRPVEARPTRRPLDEKQVLAWCVAHRDRTGRWPTPKSGPVANVADENWSTVDSALQAGWRGLSGGSSLARLRVLESRLRPVANVPPYSIDEILRWADCHHARRGRWPSLGSGLIPEAPGETWRQVHYALADGRRGLPGGSSLARVLVDGRGARVRRRLLPLSTDLILVWADAHYARTGQWPRTPSGPIPEAPGESWGKVQSALYCGTRGFPGRSSIVRLLREKRGVSGRRQLYPLSILQVRAWAQAFHASNGRWPTPEAGPIAECPGEKWSAVSKALSRGSRGLPGGYSLDRLLAEISRAESSARPAASGS